MDRHAAPAAPARRDDRTGTGPGRRPWPAARGGGDEPAVAATEALILEDAGLAVTVAPDGGAALAALAGARPDLVVLDLELPGVSGLRLLEGLKGDPDTAAVPVLAVTALDFAEARAGSADEGREEAVAVAHDLGPSARAHEGPHGGRSPDPGKRPAARGSDRSGPEPGAVAVSRRRWTSQ